MYKRQHIYTYVHPKKKPKKGKKEEKRRENPPPKNMNLSSGRRPSSEGTTLLFADTTSRMICPVGGPTEGRHDKTRILYGSKIKRVRTNFVDNTFFFEGPQKKKRRKKWEIK